MNEWRKMGEGRKEEHSNDGHGQVRVGEPVAARNFIGSNGLASFEQAETVTLPSLPLPPRQKCG